GKVKPGYGRILTFALNGTAVLNVPAFGHTEPPAPAIEIKASRETVHEGALLYGANCAGCHGINVLAGPLPDLRYPTKAVHEGFENIVLEGEKESLGMPSFNGILKPEEVHAIQAYVLSRSAESQKAAVKK